MLLEAAKLILKTTDIPDDLRSGVMSRRRFLGESAKNTVIALGVATVADRAAVGFDRLANRLEKEVPVKAFEMEQRIAARTAEENTEFDLDSMLGQDVYEEDPLGDAFQSYELLVKESGDLRGAMIKVEFARIAGVVSRIGEAAELVRAGRLVTNSVYRLGDGGPGFAEDLSVENKDEVVDL